MGKTETIYNNLSPNFNKVFDISYYFEKNQIIRVDIYDADDDDDHELIGTYQQNLNKLLTSAGQTIKADLNYNGDKGVKNRGKIIIRADSVNQCNHEVRMNIQAYLTTMQQKGILCFCKGNSDHPYLTISRESQADDETHEQWIQVFESKINEETSKIFVDIKKIKIKLQRLCNNNKKLPLKFALYNFINNEKRLLYGLLETNIETILKQPGTVFDLVDPKGKVSGNISFPQFEIVEQQSFIEFLKDGWFMNMSVAVDFTASNGLLHEIDEDPTTLNDYETSIIEVGRVLEPYAYKSKFAGFGFGGIPRY